MRNRKLRSGENFQRALKQKYLKEKGVKEGLNVFRENPIRASLFSPQIPHRLS
jgi:hypothetical protein